MSNFAREIEESVLPHYELNIQAIEPSFENWYKLKTDKGNKWLHMDTDPMLVKKRYAITEQLAHLGFRRTLRAIRTRSGEPVVQVQNRLYTLMDEWAGRPAGFTMQDSNLCGANLAKLHLALEQVIWPKEVPLDYRHGKWLQRFQEGAHELRTAASDPNSSASVILPCIAAGDQAVFDLQRLDYERWAVQDSVRGGLCAGDYTMGSFRITPEGRVVTIDLHQIAFDSPLYDLGRAAMHFAENGAASLFGSFLDGYEYHRTLSAYEKQLVMSYITFPHGPYRLVSYGRRSGSALPNNWERYLHEAAAKHQACLEVKELIERRGLS